MLNQIQTQDVCKTWCKLLFNRICTSIFGSLAISPGKQVHIANMENVAHSMENVSLVAYLRWNDKHIVWHIYLCEPTPAQQTK